MKYMSFLLVMLLAGGVLLLSSCGSGESQQEDDIAYYTCPMHPEIQEDQPGSCPICGMNLTPVRHDHPEADDQSQGEAQIEHWTCPMHPEIKDDEPGSCPICGMDLVPVYADHEEHEEGSAATRALRITPVQQQIIGMQYDTVKVRPLKKSMRTIGRLTHAEPNVTEIVTRVSGYIEKAFVIETGVHIHKGQKLVTVYSPELISAQQDYLLAWKGKNQRIASQARERLRLLNMPESEIKRLEEKGNPLQEVALMAPSSGHIMINNVRPGMKFQPGSMLYKINDHSTLWLLADIYEDDLPFVQLGQPVAFEIQGRPGETYQGTVVFIPPMMDPMTRTIPVRIEVPNPDFKLKMDQYARVNFVDDLDERLAVHRDAVFITGKRAVVFKEIGRGRFEPVEVHLGPLAGEYYEVLHGLNEGERVVTSGRFWLDAESRLRGVGAMAGHEH